MSVSGGRKVCLQNRPGAGEISWRRVMPLSAGGREIGTRGGAGRAFWAAQMHLDTARFVFIVPRHVGGLAPFRVPALPCRIRQS
jgi:hypothetical protein